MTNPKTPLRGRASGLRSHGTGRVAAPGQLQAGDVAPAEAEADGVALRQLASQYGLTPSAQRPPVFSYIRQLWLRRHFIMAFATARNIAMYTEAKLGQLWQILTPVLNAAVYFLVFGVLLHISRGIPNYVAFLVTGVFVFNYTQRVFISTSSVMVNSLPLIRALQFPRASLPLAYVVIELEQMFLSMAVLMVIVLATGEPITWYWLLVIPALLLQTLFNMGAGLLVARLGAEVNDFSQLLPFLMRTWLYLSGVVFSIPTLAVSHRWVVTVLELNPAAIYITLVRDALLTSQRLSEPGRKPYSSALCYVWNHAGHRDGASQRLLYDSAHCAPYANPNYFWFFGIGWALLAIVVGFFFFWRAEMRYGRG